MRPPSKRGHRACPSFLARAGLSCGTRGIRLRLLPSGPDLIRVPTSRRTRPSTPPRRTDPDGQPLGTGFGPARADCGLQGTADSPPSTVRWRSYPAGRRIGALTALPIAAIQVDTGSFFAIVVVAALAAVTVAVVPETLRAAGGRARAAAGDPDRPARPRPRPHRRLHRILLQPRPRDALLLRRLRDRLRADQGQAAEARRLGLAALGRRSPTGSAASSPRPGSSSPSSTPARRWRRRRSAR